MKNHIIVLILYAIITGFNYYIITDKFEVISTQLIDINVRCWR